MASLNHIIIHLPIIHLIPSLPLGPLLNGPVNTSLLAVCLLGWVNTTSFTLLPFKLQNGLLAHSVVQVTWSVQLGHPQNLALTLLGGRVKSLFESNSEMTWLEMARIYSQCNLINYCGKRHWGMVEST
jgi:hypothetical protein